MQLINGEVREIRVRRDGQVPLAFTGALLRTIDGKVRHGRDNQRYYELHLYCTETSRRYVLGITFHSGWEGEGERYDALILGPDQKQMIGALRMYNPVPDGIGFPQRGEYTERQAQLERLLRQQFASLVTEILDGIEGAEERIE